MNRDLKFELNQEVWFSGARDIESKQGKVVGFFLQVDPKDEGKTYFYQIEYKSKVTKKDGTVVEKELLTCLPCTEIELTKVKIDKATIGSKRLVVDKTIEEIERDLLGFDTDIKFKQEMKVEAEKELVRFKELREKYKK